MTATRERWAELCKRFGLKDNPTTGRTIDGTYDQLFGAYAGPDRHYHNLDHISNGLALLDNIPPSSIRTVLLDVEVKDVVEFAWWWHDYVYNAASLDNEKLSALAAIDALFEFDFRSINSPHKYSTAAIADCFSLLKLAARVNNLIRATDHKEVSPQEIESIITDIDLASLGTPPDVFDANTANIRKEYARVSDEAFKLGRAEFFRRFLAGRPSIYLTDYFRTRYEAQAQENLKRIVTSASSK